MNYSFDTIAPSQADAKKAIADSLTAIANDADRAAITAAAGTVLDMLEIDATRNISVSMRGAIARGPGGVQYCDMSLTVMLAPRAA